MPVREEWRRISLSTIQKLFNTENIFPLQKNCSILEIFFLHVAWKRSHDFYFVFFPLKLLLIVESWTPSLAHWAKMTACFTFISHHSAGYLKSVTVGLETQTFHPSPEHSGAHLQRGSPQEHRNKPLCSLKHPRGVRCANCPSLSPCSKHKEGPEQNLHQKWAEHAKTIWTIWGTNFKQFLPFSFLFHLLFFNTWMFNGFF